MNDRLHTMALIAVFQRGVMPYRRPFFAKAAALLAAEGYRLSIYSADEGEETSARGGAGQPLYVPLGTAFTRTLKARDIQEKLTIPKGLLRRLWRDAPAVIVSEDISALPSSLVMPLLRLLRGTPYLIWTLGPSILGKQRSRWRVLATPVIALLRRPAAGFITYSNWAASALRGLYDKPTTTAPNSAAFDLVPFQANPVGPDGRLRVLFIGRLTQQKHVDRLLKAMATLSVPVSLDILGDGEEAPRLRALAGQLGLQDAVHFHGDVRDPHRKAAFISQCHCGVMPGLGGLFIQELQAMGRPVITGPADGTEQDLVRDVNPELYLPIVSVDGLGAALESLATDPALLARAQSNARQVVETFYNIDTMAQQWVAAVLAIANANKGRAS